MLDVGPWNFTLRLRGSNSDDELSQSLSINSLEPIVVKVNQGIIPKSTVDLGMRPSRLAGETWSSPHFFVFAFPRLCVRFQPSKQYPSQALPFPPREGLYVGSNLRLCVPAALR
jgi:hypothetical protein